MPDPLQPAPEPTHPAVEPVHPAAEPVHPTPELRETPPEPPTPARPAERVGRGLLFALLAIPAGIAVWVLLWQWGFIASIAAFGVAWAALLLYQWGSGGTVSRSGFWVVVGVTGATLVLSFLSGMAWDMATFLELEVATAFASSEFWALFQLNLTDNPELWGAYVPDILVSLLLAVLGTFSVFRALAKQTSGTPELGLQ